MEIPFAEGNYKAVGKAATAEIIHSRESSEETTAVRIHQHSTAGSTEAQVKAGTAVDAMLTAGGTLAIAMTPTTSVIPKWRLYPQQELQGRTFTAEKTTTTRGATPAQETTGTSGVINFSD